MPTIEQIQDLLATQPDDVFLNFALAMALGKAGQPDDAFARFDRALSLDPNYHAAYFHKSQLLMAHGRLEDAKTLLRRGIEVTGRLGEAHAEGEMQGLLDSLG